MEQHFLNIIAHRGFWESNIEKNTKLAFERALENGFGIETDLRDYQGELVISHDVPTGGEQSFDSFASQVSRLNASATIAINIKSDGLQQLLSTLHDTKLNYFVFDMSVPDMLNFKKKGFRFFTRYSEYEPTPSMFEQANGVWMDNFSTKELNTAKLKNFLEHGKDVALVSPELHGFDPDDYWQTLSDFFTDNSQYASKVILCTDYPQKAREFFNE